MPADIAPAAAAPATAAEQLADCSDCPPLGYPTDATRCRECPRLADFPGFTAEQIHAGLTVPAVLDRAED